MPVYYLGPMPKTDEERAAMRDDALSTLRRMKEEISRIIETSRHGSNVLLTTSDQDRYNENVHKLIIAGAALNANDFYTYPPIPKDKKRGQYYDGVQSSVLLSRVEGILRKLDSEQ